MAMVSGSILDCIFFVLLLQTYPSSILLGFWDGVGAGDGFGGIVAGGVG
jgi:hypothetical protein